jgi:hypothetical protein
MPVREDMLKLLCGGEIGHIVILHPPGYVAPAEVESAVRGLTQASLRFAEPLEAFAEIALHDRLESTRSAWGLAPAGIACLIVIDGRSSFDLDRMARAISKYFEEVAVVEYEGGAGAPWRLLAGPRARERGDSAHPFRRHQPIESERRQGASARSAAPLAPTLRLVDHRHGVADTGEQQAPGGAPRPHHESGQENGFLEESEDDAAPSVTRDEIAMLLGGDSGDDEEANDGRLEAAP